MDGDGDQARDAHPDHQAGQYDQGEQAERQLSGLVIGVRLDERAIHARFEIADDFLVVERGDQSCA